MSSVVDDYGIDQYLSDLGAPAEDRIVMAAIAASQRKRVLAAAVSPWTMYGIMHRTRLVAIGEEPPMHVRIHTPVGVVRVWVDDGIQGDGIVRWLTDPRTPEPFGTHERLLEIAEFFMGLADAARRRW